MPLKNIIIIILILNKKYIIYLKELNEKLIFILLNFYLKY